MGKSVVEEIAGEKGSRPRGRVKRKRVVFACLGVIVAAVVLSSFDQSVMSANEEYIRNELPGHPEFDPPRSEEEFFYRMTSGFVRTGPRKRDHYPGMDQLPKKPPWWDD